MGALASNTAAAVQKVSSNAQVRGKPPPAQRTISAPSIFSAAASPGISRAAQRVAQPEGTPTREQRKDQIIQRRRLGSRFGSASGKATEGLLA